MLTRIQLLWVYIVWGSIVKHATNTRDIGHKGRNMGFRLAGPQIRSLYTKGYQDQCNIHVEMSTTYIILTSFSNISPDLEAMSCLIFHYHEQNAHRFAPSGREVTLVRRSNDKSEAHVRAGQQHFSYWVDAYELEHRALARRPRQAGLDCDRIARQ